MYKHLYTYKSVRKLSLNGSCERDIMCNVFVIVNLVNFTGNAS